MKLFRIELDGELYFAAKIENIPVDRDAALVDLHITIANEHLTTLCLTSVWRNSWGLGYPRAEYHTDQMIIPISQIRAIYIEERKDIEPERSEKQPGDDDPEYQDYLKRMMKQGRPALSWLDWKGKVTSLRDRSAAYDRFWRSLQEKYPNGNYQQADEDRMNRMVDGISAIEIELGY